MIRAEMNETMLDLTAIGVAAANLVGRDGLPEQEQPYPGLTDKMDPIPDHGEKDWVGHNRLNGLRALITGGDSGIGRAVAIAFAREGCDVALSFLPEEQSDAEEVARWVERAGRRCVLLPGDLRDETVARQVVEDAAGQLGGLEILVNNAGYQWARGRQGLADLTTQDMDRVFRTNLYAMFWVTQQALGHLKGKSSSIINVSSIQAYDPSTALIDYAATKAAISNFTVNLAAELGPRGIRVNCVAPGPIWTPLQPATQDGSHLAEFGVNTPLGRPGQPSELAGAFVFLASPLEASYVSGTVLGVTGGRPIF